MARPTKLTEELIAQAEDYLENFESLGDPVPMLCGLASELRISRETVVDWEKTDRDPRFSCIVKGIRITQRRILQAKGLNGEHNQSITKLMLSAHHGVNEKKAVEHSGEVTVKSMLSDLDGTGLI